METKPIYTAISFAPVQGFIEKSRKLRDLFGASLILSYLSQQLVLQANQTEGCRVISPALISVQQGMPNRILVKGEFSRNDTTNTLIEAWAKVLDACRIWLEENIPAAQDACWNEEWRRWQQYTWEIFWGHGASPASAMQDLERRKLKRDWTAVNWVGESSSLTGTDAIAWPRLGEQRDPKNSLSEGEKSDLLEFYRQLAWILDDPYQRSGQVIPEDTEPQDFGKFIAANERLSIPELVKRLVTLPKIANSIGMELLEEGFTDIYRETGYWSGWFMGDGDKVGQTLKNVSDKYRDEGLEKFSSAMRSWGKNFLCKPTQTMPENVRVVYAGGDDFLGVICSEKSDTKTPAKINHQDLLKWLLVLPKQWQGLQTELKKEFQIQQTFSVGFVWTGHQVPQRDILQHCRAAEKRAKSLGRDRVTIRVVFNSGQFIQWTCPWDCLEILTKYRDREKRVWGNPDLNWGHLYNDWAQLKARQAIRVKEIGRNPVQSELALALLNLYFDDAESWLKAKESNELKGWRYVTGDDTDSAVCQWIEDLIMVGWQLCSNT